MSDRIRIIQRVIIYDYMAARESSEGKGLNKFASAFGHGHANEASGTLQPSQYLRGFVAGNPSRYTEGDLSRWSY